MGIYVEIRVRGSLEELWRRTQQPELHERWDLRFSEIVYLPRPHEAAPQQFSYATRIGSACGSAERARAKGAGPAQPASVSWRSRSGPGTRNR